MKGNTLTERTLIIGSGPCAGNVASELLENGIDISIVAKDKSADLFLPFPGGKKENGTEILSETRVLSCRGSAGNFIISMESAGKVIYRSTANIIIAEENQRKPNFSLYNLEPGPGVISLSEVAEFISDAKVEEDNPSSAQIIVFLTGLAKESNTVIMEEIMRHCLQLQRNPKRQTFILSKNLKVSGNGLEALYRKTKNAGATYIKFSDTVPEIHQGDDGRISIEFVDELTQQTFSLNPNVTIVDETISPSEYLTNLAEIFGLDRGQGGFVQTENIHRISVLTNRKGITVVGPSRRIQPVDHHCIDAGNAAISTIGLVRNKIPKSEIAAEINPDRCVGCLNCYRVCPHHAILLDNCTNVKVMPSACEGCGICAAECLASAIDIKGSGFVNILEQISDSRHTSVPKPFVPYLMIFCCSHSASQARQLATSMGYALPQNFKVIEVPCAGAISCNHLFSAFNNNIDGVLVLACHEGNCRSEKGNIYAKQRVGLVTRLFTTIGIEKERFKISSLASNMGKEFANILMGFEEEIHDLGPSRLNQV
jgi:coenzyme F420-reducing hydrogenase delta subunit/Pyruvate/2-oxoacid:ferredoxin oxidoreductase delta subunit